MSLISKVCISSPQTQHFDIPHLTPGNDAVCGCKLFNTDFLVAALIYEQQLLLKNKRDFPIERDDVTNLFLRARAGEDAPLLLQAGGDNSGHYSRTGHVFYLWSHTHTHTHIAFST